MKALHIVLAVSLAVGLAHGQPRKARKAGSLANLSAAIEEVANTASPAVVQITVRTRAPLENGNSERAGFLATRRATGSGVILEAEGYIVTNAHVVERAQGIDVSVQAPNQPDGDDHRHFPAKIAGVDRETDLALLKIEATGLPVLGFLDSDKLKQGQMVIALGSPLGLENSLTVGFVSAPVRHLDPDEPMFYVQTDAPINPGNSGGPLLDTSGRIVGINTMILTQSGGSEGIGLAIPGNLVQRVYRDLRTAGRVRRGVIGVVPQEITPVLAAAMGLEHHSGVILSDVTPHGAADASGLRPGDIVLAVDGKPVRAARQFKSAIFQRSYGEEVTLEIERGSERQKKTVMIMEPPSDSGGVGELANRDPRLIRQLGILALTLDQHVTDVLPALRRLSGVAVAAIPIEFAGFNPGLVGGDVIYSVNGRRVNSLDELETALGGKKPGDPIALEVEREGYLIYVSFELD